MNLEKNGQIEKGKHDEVVKLEVQTLRQRSVSQKDRIERLLERIVKAVRA